MGPGETERGGRGQERERREKREIRERKTEREKRERETYPYVQVAVGWCLVLN
jgi:hypothetical protein